MASADWQIISNIQNDRNFLQVEIQFLSVVEIPTKHSIYIIITFSLETDVGLLIIIIGQFCSFMIVLEQASLSSVSIQ